MSLPKRIDELTTATVISAGAQIAIVTGGFTRKAAIGGIFTSQGIVSVKDPAYGAIGDGVTDDTAAIQSAIDAVKDSSETTQLTETRFLYFPKGIYLISSPINLYSGIVLFGNGQGSLIKASGGFAGTALVLLKGQGANAYCQFAGYRHMGFECTGTIWCVKANATNIVDCNFIDGWMDCGFGLDLGTYTQACTVDTLFGHGNIDQLFHLKGNWNKIRNIDKEGNTGSSADPYVLIENHSSADSSGNELEGILLQQTTSANKSLIKLLSCENTVLSQIWLEPTLTDGYGIRIDDCLNTRIRTIPSGISTTTKIKVDTSRNTVIEMLDISGAELSPGDVFEIDATSDVQVGALKTRRGMDQYVLANMDRNFLIDKAYLTQIFTDSAAGYSPLNQSRWLCGQNLAKNGSFEAGNYGWTFSVSPTTTEEYITSEVGTGLMGHFVYAAANTYNHYQSITVPANMPVTLTAKVKIVAGSAGCFATLFAENLGITQSNGYSRAVLNTGWQIITRTIIPTSAGALLVGLQYVNATGIYVDEFSVAIGTVGVPNQAKYGTLELGGVTLATGSEASPSTGTWKKGDIYFTTSVTSLAPMGAICIVAGSPGTWKPMASLGA